MSAYILIPDLNPVKYVEKDILDIDNVHLFDKYNYEHIVQRFEGYKDYTQKWVNGDLVKQQLWTKDVDICNIDMVDCKGILIQNYPGNVSLSNFLINSIAYNILQFDTDTIALPIGRFFFIINYTVTGNPNTYKLISEPQEVVAELKPSILLKYSNSFNEFNTIFKTSFGSFFSQHFFLRVEGRVISEKPNSIRQTYEDQRLDLTLLSAKPFDTWRFKFGSGLGIPEWMGAKINMAISCNNVTVDSIQFTFIDDLAKKASGYYTRYLYEIVARYKEVKYVKQFFVPEVPGGLAFILPDGTEGVAYNFNYTITGNQPFSLGTLTKPAWLNVVISGDQLIFSGTPAAGDVGTGITVSIEVINSVGNHVFSDTIDIIAAAACDPVAFDGIPAINNGAVGIPYIANIALTGTLPFILSSIVKPAWATVTATSLGIEITGTPTTPVLRDSFSFDISNCGGGPTNTINFTQDIAISSGIIITGNTAFSVGVPSGMGNILAAPGTLVTVTIIATGDPLETFTLNSDVGAVITGINTVTNGTGVYTFVMPAPGSVAWDATFIATSSAGGGSISVS